MARILISLLVCSTFVSGSAVAQTFPLKVRPDKRYLEDNAGVPFFLNGDAAWSMVIQLTYAQADLYLTDRKDGNFNGVLVNLIEHKFASYAPANIDREPPFTAAPFTTPNNTYFARADSMIARANQLGIAVFLFPAYLGYAGTDEGWSAEVQAASIADLQQWGRYVGNRYKNFPNIVWVIGGDVNPAVYAGVQQKLDSMVAALKAADTVYPDRLITTHSERGTQAFTHWPEAWVTVNTIYTDYSTVGTVADQAYDLYPPVPFFLIEAQYENGTDKSGARMTPQKLRAQAFWTILRGGCGHIFGNCPIWSFGSNTGSPCSQTDWRTALSSAGSVSMTHFARLFTSRHWQLLVPDRNARVPVSGAGSGVDAAVAAYATDSSSIIVYLPSKRIVTINPSVVKGDSMHVYWYDPSTGISTDLGMLFKETRSFTQPYDSDWVLVIDGKGFSFNPPGVAQGVTSVSRPAEAPTGYRIDNYPNPFNPTTTFSFSLPSRSRVELTIFDALGRDVADVVRDDLPAGMYIHAWNADELSTGIYFYRFQAGSYTATKRLLFLK